MFRIMLDAGHYGNYNRSPVVPEYYESHMNWKLHLLLKEELEKYGFEVGTTRSDPDRDLTVTKRGECSKGYDLFLSLHSNAANSPNVDRVVVFYPFDNVNNSVELADRLANAIADVMQVTTAKVATREEPKGAEYYGVMRGARRVGCPRYYIVEHSFHTNKRSAEWLLNEQNLQRLAKVEAMTIAEFFGVTQAHLIVGDITGNGRIDSADYLLLKRYILKNADLDEEAKKRADMNGDGKIDIRDYLLLKREIINKKGG